MVKGWRDCTLGDVVELKRGYDLPNSHRRLGPVPIVSSSGISGWHNEAKVQAPGVVTGRYGTIGQVFYVDQDFWPLNTTLYVRDFKGHDEQFISYFLRSLDFQAFNDKSSVPGLNRNDLHLYGVRVPEDAGEERAIARVLGALDDKIEQNRKTAHKLDELARAIFKAWFVDFEPVKAKAAGATSFPSMSKKIFNELPAAFANTDLGAIPVGWEIKSTENFCEVISSGGTPSRRISSFWENGTIDWFKTGELIDGPLFFSTECITEAGLRSSSCKLWPEGTILFALYASPTVGRLGVLTRPGTSNQAAAGLVIKQDIGIPFMINALLEARAELQRIAVGAAQQNINQTLLKSHRLVKPPVLFSQAYSKKMQPSWDLRVALSYESLKLIELRNYLLPKLLSGQIRVKEAETMVGNAI